MEISSVVSPLLLLLLLNINKAEATDVLPLVEAVDRSGNILEQVTPDLIYRHMYVQAKSFTLFGKGCLVKCSFDQDCKEEQRTDGENTRAEGLNISGGRRSVSH